MVTVAKMTDGKIVQVVRIASTVSFSSDTGWIFICYDFDKVDRRREQFKWVPAATEFGWVRDFI